MATASAPVVRTSVAKSVFLAARNGQVHELISLLDATQPNPPVAVQEEEYGLTPLHLAILGGHAVCADILLHFGSNLEARDQLGGRPIHVATMVGKVPCIRLLIRRGANMDAVPDLAMWGCLHLSVETGRADCLEELLREGARTDLVNNRRLTPFELAIAKDNRYGAALLLAYGAALPAPHVSVEPGVLALAIQVAKRRLEEIGEGRSAAEQRDVTDWLGLPDWASTGGEPQSSPKTEQATAAEAQAAAQADGGGNGGGSATDRGSSGGSGSSSSGDRARDGRESTSGRCGIWDEPASAWASACPLGKCCALRCRADNADKLTDPRFRFAAALKGVRRGSVRDPGGRLGAARALTRFGERLRATAFDEAAKDLKEAVATEWGEASDKAQKGALLAVLRIVSAVAAEKRAREAEAAAAESAEAARIAAEEIMSRLRDRYQVTLQEYNEKERARGEVGGGSRGGGRVGGEGADADGGRVNEGEGGEGSGGGGGGGGGDGDDGGGGGGVRRRSIQDNVSAAAFHAAALLGSALRWK